MDRLKFTVAEWTFYKRILDDTRTFMQSSAAGAPKSPIPRPSEPPHHQATQIALTGTSLVLYAPRQLLHQ